jgi:hypothetical protein
MGDTSGGLGTSSSSGLQFDWRNAIFFSSAVVKTTGEQCQILLIVAPLFYLCSPYDGCQHLAFICFQVVAEAAQALVAGNPLDHMQRDTTAHGSSGQGAAEGMGAHTLQPQACAGLPQGLISGLAGLGCGGGSHGREKCFLFGGGVAVLRCPGQPIGLDFLRQPGRGPLADSLKVAAGTGQNSRT